MTDLVVRGGGLVTPREVARADVALSGGRIERIGLDLDANGAEIVDATGLLVLPGAIDVHTHLRLPDAEHPHRFRQDTEAAAHGGTTTVLTFNNPGTGISDRGAGSLMRGLEEFIERTSGEAGVDYGLSAVITGQQHDPVGELPELIASGVPTFKAFMVYDFALPDDRLEEVMRTAARHGGMLQLHCEDPEIIDPLVRAAVDRGDVACRHHALTRPAHAEGTATRRAIEMARRLEARLYIVHLSCEDALEAVAEAKERGEPVYAETCPHYLTFTDALYADPDESEVIKRVISPPLRAPSDVEALWAGLRDGVLDIVASDHVPDRLVIFSEGVAKGRIGLERMVDVLGATPSRLFGLPSKGAIEVGRDADLVLWDPGARRTLRQANLHHSSDFTPYEGLEVIGAPVRVLVGGRNPSPGRGRFLRRHIGG